MQPADENLQVKDFYARQYASSRGAGITLPVSQINSGSPGQSRVAAVTCGCRLSALIGFRRPGTAQRRSLAVCPPLIEPDLDLVVVSGVPEDLPAQQGPGAGRSIPRGMAVISASAMASGTPSIRRKPRTPGAR